MKKLLIVAVAFLFVALSAAGQDHETQFVYNHPPVFPGGDSAMAVFMQENLEYPPEARALRKSGTVRVMTEFDDQGKIIKAIAIHGPHELLNKEAERLILSMPQWEPAMVQGKPAGYQTIILVGFEL